MVATSPPQPAVTARPMPTWRELQESRTFPVATVALLTVTITGTLVQIAVPGVRLHLWRDQGALQSGEFWRLVTPLLIQYDPWQDAAIVLGLIAFIGTAVERVYGARRLLGIYVTCGVVGQACGYLWDPPDAGASVAGAGLLGALSAWLLSPRSRAPVPPRLIAVLAVLGAIVLTVHQDMHGPPLLVGFVLGTCMRLGATAAGADGSAAEC
jgi:membrane associated rhomboid family serine protease